MKLRKLHIENYKMFKDFDISFLDENDEALPIIVLAGVNGSGKTTLLECIKKFTTLLYPDDDGKMEMEILGKKELITKYEGKVITEHFPFDDDILYLPANTNLKDIKKLLPEYLRKMVWNEDIKASEAFERVRNHIKTIFQDLDMQIEFDSRDDEENLFFRNKNGDRFSIDTLSTGEKTLISKVLFLYLDEIKDKIILIDEPELSLHPSWQNKILSVYERLAEKNNCQIIIATHSPHIIGSAKSEYIRLLKKENNKIKVIDNFSNTYGLKFSQILTDVMGMEYLRVPNVAKRLEKVKSMIVKNDFQSDDFQKAWSDVEELLGKNNLELKLLRLEIASRKKNVSNK